MENKEIARTLNETADLMEIAGEDGFRIRSYRNGASAIESYPERVADIVKNPDRKVTEIAGIGKGLAAVLADIIERGSCERRDYWLEKYPPVALEFLKIQGLGPKGIAVLFEHHKITSMDELEKLCVEQKLRMLPRMGAKLEEKVLRSIEQYRRSSGRFLLGFAEQVSQDIIGYLSELDGVEKITAAGSLRRGRETVGDLDLLVTGPAAVLDRFVTYPKVGEVLGRGENKASAKVGHEGIQVDVRALPRESFGAALQYFTGSKDHNVALRSRAVRMGFKLSEYGLFRSADDTLVCSETEEQIYEALGLRWIPPELRENLGEIERAAEDRLPRLVELSDIRGDLHMHTRETDGRATLEEMAEAAKAQGYSYIAITDHSKALAMANGLDEARAVDFARQVREINKRDLGIRIFSGLECDILRDGAMDLSNDALAELDLVIGSVHSFRFDFERVVDEAVRRGVRFEINASPERLDLSPNMLRQAKARGARFSISTDAHQPKHLLNMRYGVTMARRAWLGPEDIMNTLPVEEFTQLIK